MMIDTHAHIDFECYEDDFLGLMQRAKEAGVEKIILPGVEPAGFNKIIELTQKFDNVYGALALHPSEAKKYYDGLMDEIKELILKNEKIIAIGECGLDYYWDTSFNTLQQEVFKKHIILAKELNLPILIHDREAHKDCLDILKELKPEVPVVFHCYSGSLEFAKEILNFGCYIAIGGVVTFKNSKKLKEVAKYIPLKRLLLETDCPFLTPEPYRGKQNEPSYIKFVAKEIADLRGENQEVIETVTSDNAKNIFNFN